MKALVTGGCGYVGSHLVQRLVAAGHRVHVLDDLSTGHRDALPDEVPWTRLTLGHAPDRDALCALLAEFAPEVVFHFAAASQVGESVQNPLKYWRNNVGGALMLTECMLQQGCERLVFSSTAATYGVPQSLPLREEHPTAPVNPYGHTKLAVETLLKDLAPRGLRSLSLRYFNAAGAVTPLCERHDPETHLMPIVADVALGRRGELSIHGDDYDTEDGTAVRDYVHVEDLAEAHLLGAEYLRAHEGAHVMNLGTGVGHSVQEIVAAFSRAAQATIATRVGPRRAGDPPVLVASYQRALDELGWRPRHDLARIAVDTLASRGV